MTQDLSAERAELLRRRLFERQARRRPARLEIPERAGRPALSFAQQRVWFIERLRPGGLAYVIPAAYRLLGELDVGALERAMTAVVERHESLRTRFPMDGGEPYQQVDPPRFTLGREDLSGRADPGAAAEATAAAEAATPFDLTAGPLLRVRLLHLGPAEHVLLITVHHAVFDGLSLNVLMLELAEGYAAGRAGRAPRLPELPLQYADFAAWQRRSMSGERLQGDLAYWRTRLEGVPQALDLPADRPRPREPSFRGGSVPFQVPGEVAGGLRRLAQRRRASLYMVTLAAFQAVLGRYARTTDLVVGSPVEGRTRADVQNLIGFFANTVPLRADLSGSPSFERLVDQVRETALGAFAHQELPFEKLVEELAPARDPGRNPLVQVWFNLLTADTGGDFGDLELAGLEVRQFEAEGTTTRFDLELHLFDRGTAGLSGELLYATDLFAPESAGRFIGHYLNFLAEVARAPAARVSRVPMVTGEELALFDQWNGMTVEDR